MTTDEKSTTTQPPPAASGLGRTRRLMIGIGSAVVSRGVGALAPLLLVPITFGYLGTQVYGLWMAVVSLTSMAVWADLGLGNGLMTRLSHALAVGDKALSRRLIGSAYAMLTAFAAGAFILLWLVVDRIPWQTVLNMNDTSGASVAPQIALVALGAFIVNIPLSLIQRIQYAHQEVARSNIWLALGNLASVALAFMAVAAGAGVLVVVLAVALGPILGNVLNTAWFLRHHRDSVPRLGDVGGDAARSLIGLGGRFLVVTLLSAVGLNVDTLVVAHTSGLEDAAVFAVTVRVLTALGLLVTLVNLPLWPSNAEALARGDVIWVRRTCRRMSLLSAGAVAIPGLSITALTPVLFPLWLGKSAAVPDVSLVLLITLWWTVLAAASPWFMVQNSVGVVAPQIWGWATFLAISVPLKVIAGTSFGAEGVIAAGLACYLCFVVPGAACGYRRAMQSVPATDRALK